MKNLERKGFTLIELLIVITIIGVLAVALLPRIVGIPARGRDTARIASLNQVVTALQTYYNDNGQYPSASGCLTSTAAPGSDFVESLGGNMPSDPQQANVLTVAAGTTCTGSFYYKPLTASSTARQAFMVVADLEVDGTSENFYQASSLNTKTSIETGGTAATTAHEGEDNVYAIIR